MPPVQKQSPKRGGLGHPLCRAARSAPQVPPSPKRWRRGKRVYWREPEILGPEQYKRDAAVPDRKFFVYVLETDYGHYVGHSGNLRARIRAHRDDEVWSTAGGNPELVWTSSPLHTRAEAMRFEAALKSWCAQRSPRFREITGLRLVPYSRVRSMVGKSGPAIDWTLVLKVILRGCLRLIFKGLMGGRRRRYR